MTKYRPEDRMTLKDATTKCTAIIAADRFNASVSGLGKTQTNSFFPLPESKEKKGKTNTSINDEQANIAAAPKSPGGKLG